MGRAALLTDLQRLVRRLEEDLRRRVEEDAAMAADVAREHAEATRFGRTAESAAEFRDALLTQAAVAWVLAAVFVRFLEDNGLLDDPAGGRGHWLGGATPALLQLAREQERAYFREHPRHGEREYLLHVFTEVSRLPGMAGLFDAAHNPLWRLTLSADGAQDLLDVFRSTDAESGAPAHVFGRREEEVAEGVSQTRFLGDLYQDLSESARKRYALLQTPDFVEDFLLTRTLDRAVETFGSATVRVIDPACGSGHFLLGAFRRLYSAASAAAPEANAVGVAQGVLDRVVGVDVNPFAVGIARFRLLVEVLGVCGIGRLAEAHDFKIRVAVGDALLHGMRPSETGGGTENRMLDFTGEGDQTEHYYAAEDRSELRAILEDRYHAVVANPPYITVKDKGLNALYRRKYTSCHRQYSLVCPFVERVFDLAKPREAGADGTARAGYVGLIVANSFMKREFGKKLIETHLRKWDLTHVIDTSGAHIPGHGTPTVILLGRNRLPVEKTTRAVLGIRGEPGVPEDPARGVVWSAILEAVKSKDFENAYVSSADLAQKRFYQHPWSLTGGGAVELKARIEHAEATTLGSVLEDIGAGAVTREDEVYKVGFGAARRLGVPADQVRTLVEGENVREWQIQDADGALWPYDGETLAATAAVEMIRALWPFRTQLSKRVAFGKTQLEHDLSWYEYSMFFVERFATSWIITYGEVATHNHFVLDRGGKVFNRTAPVIKLPADADESTHLGLLGLLNSSVGLFWLRQVAHCKGGQGINEGGKSESWEQFYQFGATKLKKFPLPKDRPLPLTTALDNLSQSLAALSPSTLLQADPPPTKAELTQSQAAWQTLRHRMIALQEELDWQVYALYDLLAEDAPKLTLAPETALASLPPGARPFEIVLARRLAAGETRSQWFERHASTPHLEIPAAWPEPARRLAEARLEKIARDPAIRLLERPEYKRRWLVEPWEKQLEKALRARLLDHLEDPALWSPPRLRSAARLADALRPDPRVGELAELYRGRADVDLTHLVSELVQGEGVPYLADLRYKPSGLRKRARWEEVWALQRREDALQARAELADDHPDHLAADALAEARRAEGLDAIPAPPKYKSSDFRAASVWRLRGKLDVPRERFVLFPGAERRADPTPTVGWAGWNALQRAEALATFLVEVRRTEAWEEERLLPLLAGIAELLPELEQWHNAHDPSLGMGLGDYYAAFLRDELRELRLTEADLAERLRPSDA